MRISAVLVAGLAVVWGAMVPQPAEATTFRKLTLEQRVDISDRIVRGTVTEIWTERDEHGVVWTRAQLEIADVMKGPDDSTLVIDQLGGSWAGLVTLVSGASRFSMEEELVVCLQELGSGRLVPVGMAQGKWTIRLDPYSRTEIVQRYTAPWNERYDHRFIPLPAEKDREYLADFEGQIRDHVERSAPVLSEEK